ncbi:hypothetical protein ABK040_012477 [Willaertia magna]
MKNQVLLVLSVFFLLVVCCQLHYRMEILLVNGVEVPMPCNSTSIVNDRNETCGTYDPNSPLIPCVLVPNEFRLCTYLIGNPTNSCFLEDYSQSGAKQGYANCTVFEEIDCLGSKYWIEMFSCKTKYANYQYPSALALSIAAGLFGADRFYLGHVVLGVIKLLTLGGVGVWWFVDLILLITGSLGPQDGSPWQAYW